MRKKLNHKEFKKMNIANATPAYRQTGLKINKMKNIILYMLIGFTTLVFSQKDKTSDKDEPLELTTEIKNEIRKGNKLYNKGLYADAEKAYKKTLELNPNYDKANYNFGNTQFLQNKIEEAKTQFKLVSKTTKDNFIKADSEHNLGNIAMKEKQYGPAVEAYKNSLRKNPNDDETRYNLALAQKLLKDQQNKDKKDDKKKDKKKDDKDKDKKDDKKDKDKKDDKKDEGEKDKDKKGDEDKKEDKKDGKGENKEDKKKQEPKPQPSKLSPDQVKQLLEAMNNEENKTQKKMNAKKERGRKVKQDKDW